MSFSEKGQKVDSVGDRGINGHFNMSGLGGNFDTPKRVEATRGSQPIDGGQSGHYIYEDGLYSIYPSSGKGGSQRKEGFQLRIPR